MAQAATESVKTIKRDFPFRWEGRDKKGKRLKGRSLAARASHHRGSASSRMR
jgi:hypothetical protein